MPSTSDKKLARAIMGRHEGVKYTEALRFVAELKEMRERNESRIALGAAPVIELDPQGSAWKIEESRRYFVTPGDPRIVIKLDEVHHLSGGREAFTSWFEAIQRAARVASGQARDEERRLALTRALMQTSVRSKIMGPDEAREALREQRGTLREQAEGRKDSGPGAPMFDEWHVMAHASRSRRRFGEMQRAVRAASSESRDDAGTSRCGRSKGPWTVSGPSSSAIPGPGSRTGRRSSSPEVPEPCGIRRRASYWIRPAPTLKPDYPPL
ncbi:hypothetical protein [Brachybacterium kimchii]|uniref:Uncharacterized protein n=1 Tax=Brachybacterium kimchii TaxID=2942909 RepID=A0ABY4N7H0_9MICO|nr:hypothetical protein [Brachybacterium kimchii]UQN30508.1 hypothetical protein M4486_03985 [Brachybacterium kimchii]